MSDHATTRQTAGQRPHARCFPHQAASRVIGTARPPARTCESEEETVSLLVRAGIGRKAQRALLVTHARTQDATRWIRKKKETN
jgi:hypothetical protein